MTTTERQLEELIRLARRRDRRQSGPVYLIGCIFVFALAMLGYGLVQRVLAPAANTPQVLYGAGPLLKGKR